MNELTTARTMGLYPLLRKEDNKIVAGMSVDRFVLGAGFTIVSGWMIGGGEVTFSSLEGTPLEPHSTSYFDRDDVAQGYKAGAALVRGFLAVWRTELVGEVRLQAKWDDGLGVDLAAPARSSVEEIALLLRENVDRLAELFRVLSHVPQFVVELVRYLPGAPEGFNQARGFLERARGVSDIGGLVVGWTVAEPGGEFFLIDWEGHVVNLESAARWTRGDIVQALIGEFGGYVLSAGFLQGWHRKIRIGAEIQLVFLVEDKALRLSVVQWTTAPIEPTAFANWAFDFPTPREKFSERLTRHDGPIIEALVERKIARRQNSNLENLQYGKRVERPQCSIVIPLFARHDFMLDQILEFNEDEMIKKNVEIIYVIDDPKLMSSVAAEAPLLSATYGVPFRAVGDGQNRGFAGASNLGVSVSSAPRVLLMNSDVIPVAPGWLQRMIAVLDARPTMGILGVRLHHPNGAIQHDGMEFRWEPGWGAYLNKHPGAGLDARPADGGVADCIAVTAACALMRRDVYDAVGGLDERFLIGDFEDSDLCLKVRKLGLEIGCLQLPISLIHLERQSFSAIGSPSFRDYVARYNAWRHQTLWGAFISQLSNTATASGITR